MCDVDEEAVVAAVDAPSIYDIPKVLHSEGLDAYVVRRLGLPFRDVDWTAWDDLLRRVHKPAHEVTVGLVGKYIDLPDAYLSVTEALRAGGFANDCKVELRWVASRRLPDPGGRGAAAGRRRRGLRAGRLRRARHRGQARRDQARPREPRADAGALPRPAVHGDRVRPHRRRPRRRQLAGVRRRDPAPGDRDHGRPARRRRGGARHGRHHAPRALPGEARRGLARARGLRRAVRRGAAPPPLRGQQRLPRPAGGGRAAVQRHLAGRAAGGVRRAARARCTPTSWPPRPTRSSGRGRPGRTRCSPA